MKSQFFLLSLYMLGLAGCGSLGDPIPYTQTEAYRQKQDAAKEESKAKTESPSKD